jgi:transposase
MPCALDEGFHQGHVAYFIHDTVDRLELRAIHACYGGDGPRYQPHHPALMVKVLVYAYASGIFRSRKIAKKLHEEMALRELRADNFLAHKAIRNFSTLHLGDFTVLSVN